jgi:hypothetical protein
LPTGLYTQFRNDSQSGVAAAKALRTGYDALYQINVRDQVSAVWPIDRIKEATAALKAAEVTPAVLDHDREVGCAKRLVLRYGPMIARSTT